MAFVRPNFSFINPTKKAQLAHVANLISMARFDGKITQNEEEYIVDVAKAFGLTQAELDQCFKDSDNLVIEIPKSDDDKVDYMKNLVSMMLSDGTIDQQKRNFVEHVCEKFGYNGKEAVDIIYEELMRDVWDDYTEGAVYDSSKMTEKEYQEEIQRRIKGGIDCLKQNDMSGAFDQLFYVALVDETARRLFLRIPRGHYPLFMLTKNQVAEMKAYSDKGYAVAQYALGRYYQLVEPSKESLSQAGKLFEAAAQGGISEAIYGLALLARYDFYEKPDIEKYMALREEAVEKGSVSAFYSTAEDIIYGWDGYEKDPKYVIDVVSSLIKKATGYEISDDEAPFIFEPKYQRLLGNINADIFNCEPEYFALLGYAYANIHHIIRAKNAYSRAVSMGFYEVMQNLIEIENDYGAGPSEECGKRVLAYYKFGVEHNDAWCYAMRSIDEEVGYDLYECPSQRVMEAHKADWEKAYQLGYNTAAYILGVCYCEGYHGFEENYHKAWDWFSKGAARNDSDCFTGLVEMASGCNPEKVSERFRAFCNLCACRLRLRVERIRLSGNTDSGDMYGHYYAHSLAFNMGDFQQVIKDCQKGLLDDYRNEIEKYYLPIYNQIMKK